MENFAASGASSSQSPDWSKESVDLQSVPTLRVGPGGSVLLYNFDLHGEARRAQLQTYFGICRQATGVHVTTSCFKVWRQNKKTNAFGKVIPTTPFAQMPSGAPPVRVFFFDDNLDLHGAESDPGICNLRDTHTAKFVSFADGRNGFTRGRAGRHTSILHSTEYNSVLVKANILDAIEDKDYFHAIIEAYSKPGEKLIVYMDVNSTIVCNDSVQSKDLSASLLSTMFELMVLVPRSPFDFGWGSCPPVSVQKRCSLKSLVKDLTINDHRAYNAFFSEANCQTFLNDLINFADVRWGDADENMTPTDFVTMYSKYLQTVSQGIDASGTAQSWFRCARAMQAEHLLMLNSFGVDTRKVVLATEPDETKVLQLCVNYELWDKRDVDKFGEQFAEPA
ncbi:unnamed protein product [Prorocentrum cordatum]|uniref:Uncharacterized protein n=1 Tax=Prorocentrum cordatum TaxID=2364126 RepID=A0ABN9Q8P4_9DINO|nr:unnamed protein product [Polarella glacialis]